MAVLTKLTHFCLLHSKTSHNGWVQRKNQGPQTTTHRPGDHGDFVPCESPPHCLQQDIHISEPAACLLRYNSCPLFQAVFGSLWIRDLRGKVDVTESEFSILTTIHPFLEDASGLLVLKYIGEDYIMKEMLIASVTNKYLCLLSV